MWYLVVVMQGVLTLYPMPNYPTSQSTYDHCKRLEAAVRETYKRTGRIMALETMCFNTRTGQDHNR